MFGAGGNLLVFNRKSVNNPILGFGNTLAMHNGVAREPHELTKEGTPNITFFWVELCSRIFGQT